MAVFIFKSLRSFLDLWYICTESRGERRWLSHHNLRGLLFNFRKTVIFDFTTAFPVFQPVLSRFPVSNQELSPPFILNVKYTSKPFIYLYYTVHTKDSTCAFVIFSLVVQNGGGGRGWGMEDLR